MFFGVEAWGSPVGPSGLASFCLYRLHCCCEIWAKKQMGEVGVAVCAHHCNGMIKVFKTMSKLQLIEWV